MGLTCIALIGAGLIGYAIACLRFLGLRRRVRELTRLYRELIARLAAIGVDPFQVDPAPPTPGLRMIRGKRP